MIGDDCVYLPGKGSVGVDNILNDDPALSLDLGYINWDGELEKCEYGCHEALATEIVRGKGWEDEAVFSEYTLWSDYLVKEKGYVQVDFLQHKGSLTYAKPLTKRQKDLLEIYKAKGFEEYDLGSWKR